MPETKSKIGIVLFGLQSAQKDSASASDRSLQKCAPSLVSDPKINMRYKWSSFQTRVRNDLDVIKFSLVFIF